MKDSEEVRDVLAAIATVLGPIKAASGHQAIDEIVKLPNWDCVRANFQNVSAETTWKKSRFRFSDF